MKTQHMKIVTQNKDIVGVLGAVALAWSVPFISMLVTGEFGWDRGDFVVIGLLVGSAGLVYVALSRIVKLTQHKMLIGAGIVFAVLWLWAELAVGIFTNWGS